VLSALCVDFTNCAGTAAQNGAIVHSNPPAFRTTMVEREPGLPGFGSFKHEIDGCE
jgi:hypothetical protein